MYFLSPNETLSKKRLYPPQGLAMLLLSLLLLLRFAFHFVSVLPCRVANSGGAGRALRSRAGERQPD